MNTKTSEDYARELAALKEEMLRQKLEEKQSLADKQKAEPSPEEERKLRTDRIINRILIVIFAMMILSGIVASIFKTPLLFGIFFALLGVLIVIISITGETKKKSNIGIHYVRIKSRDIISRCGFAVIGIAFVAGVICALTGHENFIGYLILAAFAVFILAMTATGIMPYFYMLRHTKQLKKVCTEPAEGICSKCHKKDKIDLINERIEIMPCYVIPKKRKGASRAGYPRYFCCPVYEAEFSGQILTLCDGRYNNFDIPAEGERRELLINPDNTQEFYDIRRYKKELSAALLHAVVNLLMLVPFVMIFVFIMIIIH